MSRLTYKVNDAYYVKDPRHLYDDTWELVQELGKLEDLEDELGCPLDVVFKALKDGIYHEFGDLLYDGENLKLHHIKKQGWGLYPIICDYDEAEAFFLKDYKKTWWLKGDLSE